MISIERLGVVLKNGVPVYGGDRVAKFNPGMWFDGKDVHMLYRYGEIKKEYDENIESPYLVDDVRYARFTPDGKLLFDEEEKPAIARDTAYDSTGCQDPRIVYFEDYYYIFYCGWDIDTAEPGTSKPRPCIARTKDFKSYEKLGYADISDKDHMIFPERIHGKIAFMHRVAPDIQIDYFDSFEEALNADYWNSYHEKCDTATIMRPEFKFEELKIGGGVPPIKTEKGWLLIYHGVEDVPGGPRWGVYHMGAALLDLKDPGRVLCRLPYPLLSPEEPYEMVGDVNEVVFPVGGYVYEGNLYLSYGAADRCVAMCRMPLAELLDELEKYPVE